MKTLFLLLAMFVCCSCIAQVSSDLIIGHIEQMSENSGEEIADYSELIEAYWAITENPININSDDIDQLAELRFISVFQLEKIKKYTEDYGDIQFAEELYEIEGLEKKDIEMIIPLICFKSKNDENLNLKNVFKYGKNKILIETTQCLNKKKGYEEIEDSLLYQKPNSIYLGSPQKLYLRYNFTYNNRIEAGFVMEKDPGEYLFKKNINDSIRRLLGNKCYTGFDFVSFHIYFINLCFLKTLAIGDYKISFGQGLTMGSGMAFVARNGSLLRRNKKITASKSANETYYLRGIASTIKFNDIELTTFYSNKKSDANIITYDDTHETPLEISSLQQNGLHRTYNEIMDRKAIRQQLYGLNLSYRNSNFQIGYTLHKTDLSAELNPVNNVYNLFYFRGKSLVNQGIDFHYILDRILLYGEMAMSGNKGLAGLIGATIQPTGYIDLTFLYRNYAKDYQCLYSNAFAAGSNTRNEQGIYFSVAASIAANWQFINSIDFHRSDWLKTTTHSPSNGYEFDSQLNYQPNSSTLMFIEYRNKNKMQNTKNNNIYQRYLIEEESNMFRFHISYELKDKITLKNRIEYHFNKNEKGQYNSYLFYQDIIYNPIDKRYSLAFRYELFNAEEGSVYAYENDVLYAFSVGGLSGKGIRTYLVGKIKLMKQIQLSYKFGFTIYDGKEDIGSGLENIEGNIKGECKLQVVWSF